MKKITACIAAAVTGAALLVSGISTSLNVSADEDGTIETVTINTDDLEVNTTDPATGGPEQIGAAAESLLNSLLTSDSSETEGTAKEETVYIVADANGLPKKVIVSDWLKNAGKDAKLTDVSELTDIENVKGNETFTKNGNECVWDANGADISYQGRTDKELPVDVKVTYILDGKVMTPEEIKGRSGHVTIRFDYDNKAYREVMIDGKKEKMTVPFMMLTGVILDDDRFTNISAANAKLINDGSRTVVIGFALPGLQENLAIDRSKFELPDSLEIEADVTDFSLSMTVTMATNEIFGRLDKLDIKDLDNLSASMEELTDAMTKLTEGSEALSNGLAQLLEKSGELETGVGQLAEGAGQLKNGLSELDAGAGKLSDGAGELDTGLSQLKDGADQLKAGTGALSEGAGSLSAGITLVDAGAGDLSDGAGQLKTGLDTLAGNNEALVGGAETVFKTLLATATSQIKEGGAAIPDLTIENYGEVLDGIVAQINQAVALYEKSDVKTAAAYKEKAKAVAELKASLDGYNTFYMGLKTYTDGVAEAAVGAGTLKDGVDTLKAGTGALKDGADTLKNGADALNGGVDALDDGAEQLKAGADALKSGADSLKEGTGKLADGAGKLSNGLNELNNNMPALKDGVQQLYDGSVQMSDGIKEFNERGISKITEAVEGELEGIFERVRVMGEISRAYNNFSGISDDMTGQVKFIYRTDEIK
ncbi:MAG: hypothetical protein K5795_00220 [Lachnospiraceae bacterium]|nr:hypothetical protein [Lachnospiraceae bacterium]